MAKKKKAGSDVAKVREGEKFLLVGGRIYRRQAYNNDQSEIYLRPEVNLT